MIYVLYMTYSTLWVKDIVTGVFMRVMVLRDRPLWNTYMKTYDASPAVVQIFCCGVVLKHWRRAIVTTLKLLYCCFGFLKSSKLSAASMTAAITS